MSIRHFIISLVIYLSFVLYDYLFIQVIIYLVLTPIILHTPKLRCLATSLLLAAIFIGQAAKLWSQMTQKTFPLSFESIYQLWCWFLKDLVRYDPTSCLVSLLTILMYGCTGQTVSKIKNLLKNWLKIALMCANSGEDWTRIVEGIAKKRVFLIFIVQKNPIWRP